MSAAPQIPSALAAEAWLLGAFLVDPRLIPAELTAAEFFEPSGANGWVMRAIRTIHAARGHVSVVSVAEWLQGQNMLEAVGGPLRIADLAANVGTTVGLEHYLALVRDTAARRAIIDACHAAAAVAMETTDAADVVTRVEGLVKTTIGRIRERGTASMIPMAAIVDREFAAFGQRSAGRAAPALSTGLRTLDEHLGGGLYGGDLIVVAGRPAMGKSALSGGMAVAAAKQGRVSSTHNLEMGQSQQFLRVWSAEARVPMPWLRNPTASASPTLIAQATEGIARISEFGRYLFVQHEDRPVTVEQIADDVRRVHASSGLSLAVVDYIGLVRATDRRAGREQQIAHVSRELKSLAKELDVPVVALSQVNRQCETRTDKRPTLSDLRESGAVEQDADVVLLCYRDEYYSPESTDKGVAEIIVAKQRNGGTGVARVAFVDRYAKFADLQPYNSGKGAPWAD